MLQNSEQELSNTMSQIPRSHSEFLQICVCKDYILKIMTIMMITND